MTVQKELKQLAKQFSKQAAAIVASGSSQRLKELQAGYQALQRENARLRGLLGMAPESLEVLTPPKRYQSVRPAAVAAQMSRLKLTRRSMAKLLGVDVPTVRSFERSGIAKDHPAHLSFVGLKSLGSRAVQLRLKGGSTPPAIAPKREAASPKSGNGVSAHQVRQLRAKLGVSSGELAILFGTSMSTVMLYERAGIPPTSGQAIDTFEQLNEESRTSVQARLTRMATQMLPTPTVASKKKATRKSGARKLPQKPRGKTRVPAKPPAKRPAARARRTAKKRR